MFVSDVRHGDSPESAITAFVPDRGWVQWEPPSHAQPETLNHEFPHVPPLRQPESSPAVGQSVPV